MINREKNMRFFKLLLIAAIITIFSIPVFGQENIASVNGKYYTTVQDAVNHMKSGQTLVLLNDLGDSRTGDVFSAKPDPGDPDARIPCVGIQIMNMRPNVDDDDPGWNIQAEPMPKDTTDEMVYSSGDNSILTIDQEGNVTVHKSGNTYIQVVCGDAQKAA